MWIARFTGCLWYWYYDLTRLLREREQSAKGGVIWWYLYAIAFVRHCICTSLQDCCGILVQISKPKGISGAIFKSITVFSSSTTLS